MHHDQGGFVSLARDVGTGADHVIGTPVRLVPSGGRVSQQLGSENVRAIRPPEPVRLRRRAEWDGAAVVALLAEFVVAFAVAGWALAQQHTTVALVALSWALIEGFGTALGRCGRRVQSVGGPARRGRDAAAVVLVLVALGWMGRGDVLAFAAVVGSSLAIRGLAMLGHRRARRSVRTMVVGRSADLSAAVAHLNSAYVSTYCISDVDDSTRGEHMHRAILSYAPDRVVIPAGVLTAQELQELSWAVEDHDIDVIVSMAAGGLSPHRLQPVHDRGVSGVRLKARGGMLGDSVVGWLHRVLASVALVALAPALLAIAVAVRLDSKGPSLFVQGRVGRHGREFRMFKFRTMHVDAEQMLHALLADNESEGGVLFKMRGDPRITRVGRFLRATSLDELPQLLNVVRGEMALIGPRPALPREVAEYDRRAWRRLAVRPGLTGLWQVSGRSNLSFQEAVRLDIDYVDNWSAGRELEIAFRTVGAVLRREGAY